MASSQAPKTGRRAVLWESEEHLLVHRIDTRRVQVRGGLKFVGHTADGSLEYKVIHSKVIGGHTVKKSKSLGFYRRMPKES